MCQFIDALALEFKRLWADYSAEGFDTIYIGGGTPSVLFFGRLEKLLEILAPAYCNGAEVTCEVNPDSVDDLKLDILKSGGVNRLSIGIQSFNDDLLRKLGRIGDSKAGRYSFSMARGIGFKNISIDLMYGIPGQELNSWMSDLEEAVRFSPSHISFYGLTLEEGTEFGKMYGQGEGARDFTSDEMFREMYYAGIDFLVGNGYRHYEISNFAKPGFESRHNLNYWMHGAYAGLGPAAAGFDGKKRWKNIADTSRYASLIDAGGSAVDEAELLDANGLISESMMLGLRLIEGVNVPQYSAKYGQDLDALYAEPMERLQRIGLLERIGDMLRLTRDGLYLSDSVICEFMLG